MSPDGSGASCGSWIEARKCFIDVEIATLESFKHAEMLGVILAHRAAFGGDIGHVVDRRGRRVRAQMAWVIPDAVAYRRSFDRPGGYIERAEKVDYAPQVAFAHHERPEFSSLVAFLGHCARAYPRSPSEVGAGHLPRHFAALWGTRSRRRRMSGI